MENKDPSSSLEDLLEKLNVVLKEDEDLHIFNKEEVKVLRLIIKTYNMFLSWGALGKVIIWLMLTAGSVALAMQALGSYLNKW